MSPDSENHIGSAVTRRDVLVRAAHGFGSIALASLLDVPAQAAAQRVNPMAAQAAAFPGQSEVCDLSLYGGRSEPHRHVRSQARAGEIQRPASATKLWHGCEPVH